MMQARKDVLSGTPEEVSRILEELSQGMSLHEYMGNTQLHSLAVELAKNHDLQVSVITYENQSQELEVTLASGSVCDPIMIDRDSSGALGQITCDLWMKIGTWTEIERATEMVAALLSTCARYASSEELRWSAFARETKDPELTPARAGLYTVRAGPERSNGSVQAAIRR